MNRIFVFVALATSSVACSAVSQDLGKNLRTDAGPAATAIPRPPAPNDAGTRGTSANALNLSGTYSCTFQADDNSVSCGGPVYRSDLQGQGLSMTVAQTGKELELGIWGLVITGTLSTNGHVDAEYRDTKCYACDFDKPLVISLEGIGDEDQVRDVDVRMYQTGSGYSDCEKRYHGTCAKN